MMKDKEPNSLPATKVRYVCVENQKLKVKLYYRQEFLEELQMWGRRRQITLATFKKKAKEGYQIEYKVVEEMPYAYAFEKHKLDVLIDLALEAKDKEWFMELTAKRNEIFV